MQRRNAARRAEAQRRAGIAYIFLRGNWDDKDDEVEVQRIQLNREHSPTPPQVNNRQSENINPFLDRRLMADTYV